MQPVLTSVPSTPPKPKDTTDDLQRKLQQKFAAQRREDMLAMQTSSIANTAENIGDVPEHPKRTPKLPRDNEKSNRKSKRLEKAILKKALRAEKALRLEKAKAEKAKAEKARSEKARSEKARSEKALMAEKALRLEKARAAKAKAKKALGLEKARSEAAKLDKGLRLEQAKLEKVAHGNEAAERLKQNQIKSKEVVQNDVEETATSTQPQMTEGSPTNSKASAGRPQGTPEAEQKEAKDNNSTSPVSHGQTAQKLDDIMNILGSSKEPEKSKKPLKRVRRPETLVANTKIKNAVLAMLTELRSQGEVLDINSGKVDAMISKYSDQLLARLRAASEETSEPLDQSEVKFHKSYFDDIEN